jgi:predicted nucleotidyltransferase
MKIDEQNLSLIKQLCEQYNVRTLSAFGSVTRDDFRENSDLDFAVDFNENDPFEYTNLYFELKNKLEKLFERHIDLIEHRAIKNQHFKKELEQTKVLIYGQ